jgi:signal transduction histidine kinase
MDQSLNDIIRHIDKPVLVVETESQAIVDANQKACFLFDRGKDLIKNRTIQTILDTDKNLEALDIISVKDSLYSLEKEEIQYSGKSVTQITFNILPGDKEQALFSHYARIAEQIVHQLRSPLSGISGYVEMLQDEETSSSKIKILGKIDAGLRDTFLLLNRIEKFAQPVSANITTFEINPFIDSLERFISHSNMHRLDIDYDKNIKFITSDFYLLGNILKELVDNALQASENLEDDTVIIRFKNSGIIEIENRINGNKYPDFDRLFLPFYTNKARQPGLGLSLCKKYCRSINLTLTPVTSNDKSVIIFEVGNILMT